MREPGSLGFVYATLSRSDYHSDYFPQVGDVISFTWEKVAEIAERYGGQADAQRLAVADSEAEYRDFALQFSKGRIPLGFSQVTGKPVVLPFKQLSALSLYFGQPKGKPIVLDNLLYILQREEAEIWIAKQNKDSLFDAGAEFDTNRLKNAERQVH